MRLSIAHLIIFFFCVNDAKSAEKEKKKSWKKIFSESNFGIEEMLTEYQYINSYLRYGNERRNEIQNKYLALDAVQSNILLYTSPCIDNYTSLLIPYFILNRAISTYIYISLMTLCCAEL